MVKEGISSSSTEPQKEKVLKPERIGLKLTIRPREERIQLVREYLTNPRYKSMVNFCDTHGDLHKSTFAGWVKKYKQTFAQLQPPSEVVQLEESEEAGDSLRQQAATTSTLKWVKTYRGGIASGKIPAVDLDAEDEEEDDDDSEDGVIDGFEATRKKRKRTAMRKGAFSLSSGSVADGYSFEILQPDDFHHHLREGAVLRDVVGFAASSFARVVAMPNTKPPVRTLEDAELYRAKIMAEAVATGNSSFQPMMTLYLTDETTPGEIIRAKNSGLVYAMKLYPAGATTNSEQGVTTMSKVQEAIQTMSNVGMPLLVHGEVVSPEVDIFDREKVFIETILAPLIRKFPDLKVVLEHITTSDAVDFVRSCSANVAATITAHHLLYNRSDLFKNGLCPHMYCLPVLKRERHRQALVEAATSGSAKFFIGTDSAPHAVGAKESACGCAGIFTAHAAVELYAEAFEAANALDKLEGFTSLHGQSFYGIPPNTQKITLRKEKWTVPQSYSFGNSLLHPLRAGESVHWKVMP